MQKLTLALLAVLAVGYNTSTHCAVNFLQKQSTPPSSRIVEADTVHLGWFNAPFEHPDVRMRGERCGWRQKQWQYVSMTSDRYVVGMSSVNVGYISNFFLYVFDIQTKKCVQFESKGLSGRRAAIAGNSLTGTSSYRSKRCNISVENHYAQGYYAVSVDCSDKSGNRISGTVTIRVKGDPLVNIREVAPHRMVYTHQSAMYRPQGTLVLNGDTMSFDSTRDYSTFDYTQGRHLYKTRWNWASAGGIASDSTPMAITFSSGTGIFYWVGNTLHRVADLSFKYADIDSTWCLTSSDSTIQLTFLPVGQRTGKTSVLRLLVSNYEQPIGTFAGIIRMPDGRVVTVGTMRGVTEEHVAKW